MNEVRHICIAVYTLGQWGSIQISGTSGLIHFWINHPGIVLPSVDPCPKEMSQVTVWRVLKVAQNKATIAAQVLVEGTK